MTIAENKAIAYADNKLQIQDPELYNTGYQRHVKMRVRVFSVGDVEEAYQNGYEDAIKDILEFIRTHTMLNANGPVCNAIKKMLEDN